MPAAVAAAQVSHMTAAFTGPIPPPEYLERYNQIVPGTAKIIVDAFERESRHRQELETSAQNANIAAQQKQQTMIAERDKAIFKSDAIGQGCGIALSIACVGGAVILLPMGMTGLREHWLRFQPPLSSRRSSPSAG
ncbi:MAG: DUF2335 domain-containing protein [Candidatus Accumulibacter sp.]|jgi:hypothetical protein|nr:DUF2335 domain-containing protein [Accumulibacter sp.]